MTRHPGGSVVQSGWYLDPRRLRNAAIPNAHAISATNSRNGQTELVLRIVQGDHPQAARNETLGEFTFSGVRPGRAGEVRLEILFEVNAEGILSVHARDLDTARLILDDYLATYKAYLPQFI